MTWQPIETAPKDGTTILIAIPRDDEWQIAGVAWRVPHGLRDVKGWAITGSCSHYGHGHNITHWMPLPEPPTKTRDNDA